MSEQILSHEQADLLNDLTETTRLVQAGRSELEKIDATKKQKLDEIEAEAKARIQLILELSKDTIDKIKANGRDIASIKNTAKDLFAKVLEFADDILRSNQEFEKYRVSILKALDELTLELKEKQIGVDHEKKLVSEQWDDIAKVRKDQDSREKLIYSRRAALDAAIREYGYKEQNVKQRLSPKINTKKKGKK